MTGTAVPRWRTLPFNEHRHMGQVLETEELTHKRQRGELSGQLSMRLYSLQSRAVEPDPPTTPRPAA